jgi:dTDP-4-dehydrorhamnose reductase
MKIVLLGGGGQIGWELRRTLAALGDVTAVPRESRDGLCGDLERPAELRETIRRLEPRIIVNAAGYTNVNRAETEPERAERVNTEAPRLLAAEAARADAWLVHYSTDYVFDGSGTTPWREDDVAAPLSVYGATKWRGEQAIRASGCKHLIFRTQWVYAARRDNFLRKILRLAAERETLEVVADQHGAPTGAELVADVTARALPLAATGRAAAGTYHLAARGETTWHAYAQTVVGEARRAGLALRATAAAIVAVTTAAGPPGASRPSNARLDAAKLERTFGLRLPDWRLGVSRVIAEIAAAERGTRAAR